MGNKNNRRLGVLVEHEIIRVMAAFFGLKHYSKDNKTDWHVASTRAVSKVRDDDGIDVIFRRTWDTLKRLAIQIKRTTVDSKTTTKIDIDPLLRIMELDEDTDKVLITRVFKKVGKSNRCKGDFVTIPLNDYLQLLQHKIDADNTTTR